MAITNDTHGTVPHTSGASTFTDSITLGTLTNGLLTVGMSSNSGFAVTGITWNGVPLTLAIQGGTSRVWIWYLLNPASGTHNLITSNGNTVGGSGNFGCNIFWASWNGIKQTGNTINTGFVNNTSYAFNTTIAPNSANNLVIGNWSDFQNSTGFSSSNLTILNEAAGTDSNAGSITGTLAYAIAAASGSQTVQMSKSSGQGTSVVVSFEPDVSAIIRSLSSTGAGA